MYRHELVKALLVVLVILAIVAFAVIVTPKAHRAQFIPRTTSTSDVNLTMDPIDALSVEGNFEALRGLTVGKIPPKQKESVYDSMNRFYSTADVDPIITGQLYGYRDETRDIYTGRTADEGQWGLQEFAVDNQPGMVGVDIGPDALSEYEGSEMGYNDGIPEQWAFPSTPIRWYKPRRADFYGHEGPEINNSDKLYPTFVQDNEPYIGEDPDPDEIDV